MLSLSPSSVSCALSCFRVADPSRFRLAAALAASSSLAFLAALAAIGYLKRRRLCRIIRRMLRLLYIYRRRLFGLSYRRRPSSSRRDPRGGGSRRHKRGLRQSRKTRSHPVMTPVLEGGPKYELTAPVAMDIGGTLTKLAYLRPPDPPLMPDFVQIESYHYTENQLGIVPADSTLNVDLSEGLFDGEGGCGIIKFLKFQSPHIVDFFDFIVAHDLHGRGGYGEDKLKSMNATGGGAYRWGEVVKEKLGIEVVRCDEMEAMITGLNFLLLHTRYELFTYYDGEMSYVDVDSADVFPYLLMSVGSGVSIIRVDGKGPGEFERVWGSNIGGATFYGLCRLLTNCKSYEEAQELWGAGDNSNVDLLVGDIYGHAYESIGLSAETVAASFGKAVRPREEMAAVPPTRRPRSQTLPARRGESYLVEDHLSSSSSTPSTSSSTPPNISTAGTTRETPSKGKRGKSSSRKNHFDASTTASSSSSSPIAEEDSQPVAHPQDIARSLMFMVSRNVAALGFLNARLCGVRRVIFSGNFVRNNPMLWENISDGLKYWSEKRNVQVEPHFLIHDGYLGALGALVTDSGF